MAHQLVGRGGLLWTGVQLNLPRDKQCSAGAVGGAGPTWGETLYDLQVIQLEGCIATTAGETNYVVSPVVDKPGALFYVDIISSNIKHHSNVAIILKRR